jgi:hypothetical protein
MSAFRGHELHRVATNETLTFEHTYTWWGHRRKLRVTAQPDQVLTAAHVPRHCRRARVVLLGPLTPRDMDSASFVRMRAGGPSCGRQRMSHTPAVLSRQASAALGESRKFVLSLAG